MSNEKTARIYFWYKGTMHKSKGKASVDFIYDDPEWIEQEAEDKLETMITRGLIDVLCTAGVHDFGIISVKKNPKGEAELKF